jgi:2-amino-4-hydroxy-6-hydroxymethyldihydropteridine diphosphokinase
VVVALGSNLGDSRAILKRAAAELQKLAAADFRLSSFYQTTPVNCPPGSPPFINAVALFTPPAGETPESLLAKLQALEKQLGRTQKRVMNEPRLLDLDLIIFGDERRNAPSLTLPHPRAHVRRFVLEPLCEIAPELPWPGLGKSAAKLLATLPESD